MLAKSGTRRRKAAPEVSAFPGDDVAGLIARAQTFNPEPSTPDLVAAMAGIAAGICVYSKTGAVILANRRFLDAFGLIEDLVTLGVTWPEMTADLPVTNTGLALEALSRLTCPGRTEQALADGRTLCISRSPVEGGGWVDTVSDITDERSTLAAAAYRARHDALTGLPNRTVLMERMQEALRLAQRGDLSAALCLDLDRFKAVNDRLGHAIGDKVLEAVGERLRNQLRGTDTAARLGGDEFAMIQGRIRSAREAQTIAQRIVTDLSRPYQIGAHEIRIGASIGIEMIDGSEQNPASILRNADLALYRAKSSGGGDVTFYEPAMQTRLDERHRLEAQLREAVSDSSLVLHYQPQVDLRSGEIMGFEALVRWQHPTRGLLEPVDFIHVAEEIGVIRQLGVRVLDLACLEAASWSRPVSVSVNLSSNQFADDGVVYDVASALQRSGLAPARLILEVTEAVLISNSPAALALLGRLKGLGVRISLDNLGVGPSFVSYAPRDVFDSVKIDPSILAMSSGKPGSMDLIEAYAAFCQTLGMSPTIGGVESQAQLARLEPGGCAVGQGFAFARPVPANDVHQLLESATRL